MSGKRSRPKISGVESPSVRKEVDSVEECVRVLEDLVIALGFCGEDIVAAQRRRTIDHWKEGATLSGSWIKFAKYKLAAFFAFHMNQELPKPPAAFTAGFDHPGHLLGGRCGRFVEGLLRKSSPDRRLGILASFKLAKKGMPRPDRAVIDKSVESTVEKLTGPAPNLREPWTWMEEVAEEAVLRLQASGGQCPELPVEHGSLLRFTRQDVTEELKRTVTEILVGPDVDEDSATYGWYDRVNPYFPSTSSNYINTRSGGGAVGFVLEDPDLLAGLRTPGGCLRLDWRADGGSGSLHVGGIGEMEQRFATLWMRLLRRASREPFEVTPVGLAEALKVRVITKGNPSAQTAMKALQRFLFKRLSRFGTFRSLICGGDLDQTFLEKTLGRLSGEQKWLSGDYEAATDNLRGWVSEVIMNQICDHLRITGVERDIALRLLTGHIIDGKAQTNGQLMGSIISFPVLCIANAALCRMVVEQDRSFTSAGGYRPQKLSLQQSQILINGDDLLLKVTPFGRWLWGLIGNKTMGLIESVGKTYYSTEFVEMNSRAYAYRADNSSPYTDIRTGKVRQHFFFPTPLINLGLVYGLVRSAAGGVKESSLVATDRNMSLGARMRELHAEVGAGGGFGAGVWGRIKWKCLSLNQTSLSRTSCPWFVTERLGGLGIPGVPTALELQLCRAARLAELHFTSHVDGSWKAWKLAGSRLSRVGGALTRTLGPAEADALAKVSGLLVVDCLFDSNVSLQDIYSDVRDNAKSALRENEKLWKRLKLGKYGFPSLRYYLSKVTGETVEKGGVDGISISNPADYLREEINLLLDRRPVPSGIPVHDSVLLY